MRKLNYLVVCLLLFAVSCTPYARYTSSTGHSGSELTKEVDEPINNNDPKDFTVSGTFKGKASYYGSKFHGRPTASGEIYDKGDLTCAHKTLEFGTMLKVTNLNNGKVVFLRVNDRGPHVKGRVLDVSYAAAEILNMIQDGVVPVEVEILNFKSQ